MKDLVRTESEMIKVLYPGYLPVFGSDGFHPQYFHYLTNPPAGYEYVYVDRGNLWGATHFVASRVKSLLSAIRNVEKLRAVIKSVKTGSVLSQLQSRSLRSLTNSPPTGKFVHTGLCNLWEAPHLAASAIKLLSSAIGNGAKLGDAIRFIMTRGMLSQLRIPTSVRLALLPTYPYILGQVPWVIAIEDTTTLFGPFVRNGQTASLQISDAPYYPFVKALLESDSCRGIITHVKSTAESIPLLFNNAALRKKIFYIPLGIQLPPMSPSRQKQEDNVIRILFTNSWSQGSTSFYLRGGLDVLEAYSILSSRYPNLRLILRTALPSNLDERYLRIIESCLVKVVDRFLPIDEMQELKSNADIYVLPSARIHVVSILEAMAYGLAVVVSDGWGITEYVENGRDGIVVPGRYGKCSWMDGNGMLREDYSPLFSSDPFVVSGLVDSLSTLIEDRELRKRLGQAGRRDIETRFSIDNWNQGLAKVFYQLLS